MVSRKYNRSKLGKSLIWIYVYSVMNLTYYHSFSSAKYRLASIIGTI